jgi:hypothetical protein
MKIRAEIDLSMTKEVPLDADVEEILDSCIEVALVCLGAIAQHWLYTARYLELIRIYI